MWLDRFFGRKDDAEPSEYPRHPASNPAVTAPPAIRSAANIPPHKPVQKAKGFDPYNSGAFRKASSWDRVGRR